MVVGNATFISLFYFLSFLEIETLLRRIRLFSFPFVNLAFSHFALKLFFISKLICRKSGRFLPSFFFQSPYVTNACLMAHADVICVKIGFECCTQIDVKQEHSLPYLKVKKKKTFFFLTFLFPKSLKFVS